MVEIPEWGFKNYFPANTSPYILIGIEEAVMVISFIARLIAFVVESK